MIPLHLYLFQIESPIDLVISLFFFLALNQLTLLIALIVLCIRKALKYKMYSRLVYAKHNCLLVCVTSALFFFLQPYLAVPLCIVWYLWGWRLFETDARYLFLLDYPVKQSPKNRRKNAETIAIAQSLQSELAKAKSWNEILHTHIRQRKQISTFIPPTDGEDHLGWQNYFSAPFQKITFFAALACIAKLISTLLSSPELWLDHAVGAPLVFLTVNAVLTATVIFGGLICGILMWNNDNVSFSSSVHSERIIVPLCILYVLIVLLFFNRLFGWF